ncbi:hypothetical protein R3P38DRAFT_2812261 [Favolaschia claudopus]|uniref:Uncharacterized protein n=1 Tax=Favolaschia claudopus TaxID=2862362 RepID=A0AAV9Z6S2_9AGAR
MHGEGCRGRGRRGRGSRGEDGGQGRNRHNRVARLWGAIAPESARSAESGDRGGGELEKIADIPCIVPELGRGLKVTAVQTPERTGMPERWRICTRWEPVLGEMQWWGLPAGSGAVQGGWEGFLVERKDRFNGSIEVMWLGGRGRQRWGERGRKQQKCYSHASRLTVIIDGSFQTPTDLAEVPSTAPWLTRDSPVVFAKGTSKMAQRYPRSVVRCPAKEGEVQP